MHYYETSAKENIGIEDAFMDALKQAIAQKTEEEEYVPEVIDLTFLARRSCFAPPSPAFPRGFLFLRYDRFARPVERESLQSECLRWRESETPTVWRESVCAQSAHFPRLQR